MSSQRAGVFLRSSRSHNYAGIIGTNQELVTRDEKDTLDDTYLEQKHRRGEARRMTKAQ